MLYDMVRDETIFPKFKPKINIEKRTLLAAESGKTLLFYLRLVLHE